MILVITWALLPGVMVAAAVVVVVVLKYVLYLIGYFAAFICSWLAGFCFDTNIGFKHEVLRVPSWHSRSPKGLKCQQASGPYQVFPTVLYILSSGWGDMKYTHRFPTSGARIIPTCRTYRKTCCRTPTFCCIQGICALFLVRINKTKVSIAEKKTHLLSFSISNAYYNYW